MLKTGNNKFDSLVNYGWLHLANKEETEIGLILQQLGQVIFTTDVIVSKESRSLVTSDQGIDVHTDHSEAKYIAWYCYKQTDKGGETVLVDLHPVYKLLPEGQKKELEKVMLHQHKVYPDDKELQPLVQYENGNARFYYSDWLLRQEHIQYQSVRQFQQLLQKQERIKLKLKPKDMLIIDNHRLVHGRTPIEGNKDRNLKRFWLK